MKSFGAKDGFDEPPLGGRKGHGETRSNDTHASTTDPEARLYRKGKGKEANLSYIGNALNENRQGLVVEAETRPGNGHYRTRSGPDDDRDRAGLRSVLTRLTMCANLSPAARVQRQVTMRGRYEFQ